MRFKTEFFLGENMVEMASLVEQYGLEDNRKSQVDAAIPEPHTVQAIDDTDNSYLMTDDEGLTTDNIPVAESLDISQIATDNLQDRASADDIKYHETIQDLPSVNRPDNTSSTNLPDDDPSTIQRDDAQEIIQHDDVSPTLQHDDVPLTV